MEILSCFTFRDNIVDLDNVETMVFQLGREKRSMTMRQFILDLGLYTPEEMGYNLFEPFYESCFRSRPHNYDPTKYVVNITTRDHYDTRHPPSYTSICNPIRHLAHHLLVLYVTGRHSRKEKIKRKGTRKMIIGAHLIDRIARSFELMTLRALRGVTLGRETSLLNVAKLVDLGICKYNALGHGEMVNDVSEVAEDEGAGGGM
ncbi:hypothetical protein Tco_0731581 [Tanacetum coccineum]